MRYNIVLATILIATLSAFGYFVYNLENNYELVTEKETHIIQAKQTVIKSTNNFGAFREEYKFLLEHGEIRDVELEEYMSYEIGDTIVVELTYKQEK